MAENNGVRGLAMEEAPFLRITHPILTPIHVQVEPSWRSLQRGDRVFHKYLVHDHRCRPSGPVPKPAWHRTVFQTPIQAQGRLHRRILPCRAQESPADPTLARMTFPLQRVQQGQELFLGENLDAQLLCLIQLAPGGFSS